MPLSENAKEKRKNYNVNYHKEHFKRVPLDISFAKYDEVKAAADNAGESVNGYIKKAIDDRLYKQN